MAEIIVALQRCVRGCGTEAAAAEASTGPREPQSGQQCAGLGVFKFHSAKGPSHVVHWADAHLAEANEHCIHALHH